MTPKKSRLLLYSSLPRNVPAFVRTVGTAGSIPSKQRALKRSNVSFTNGIVAVIAFSNGMLVNLIDGANLHNNCLCESLSTRLPRHIGHSPGIRKTCFRLPRRLCCGTRLHTSGLNPCGICARTVLAIPLRGTGFFIRLPLFGFRSKSPCVSILPLFCRNICHRAYKRILE